jgi:hypothetical protein
MEDSMKKLPTKPTKFKKETKESFPAKTSTLVEGKDYPDYEDDYDYYYDYDDGAS